MGQRRPADRQRTTLLITLNMSAALYVAVESLVIAVGRRGNDWSRRYGVECRKKG